MPSLISPSPGDVRNNIISEDYRCQLTKSLSDNRIGFVTFDGKSKKKIVVDDL